MNVLLPALAVAFTAFFVWLIVRIVNRRERRVKWIGAAVLIGLPVLYFAGFGPTCWLVGKGVISPSFASAVYKPVLHGKLFAQFKVVAIQGRTADNGYLEIMIYDINQLIEKSHISNESLLREIPEIAN